MNWGCARNRWRSLVRRNWRVARCLSRHKSQITRLKSPVLDGNMLLKNSQYWTDVCLKRNMRGLAGRIHETAQKAQLRVGALEEIQKLREQRNRLSDEIESGGNEGSVREQAKALKQRIKELEETERGTKHEIEQVLSLIPNDIHPRVPIGPEEMSEELHVDPVEVQQGQSRDHVAIAQDFGLVDFSAGSAVSGSSFYYLRNDAVRLEQALTAYSMDMAQRAGWSLTSCPSIVKAEYAEACGFQPRDEGDEQQIYYLQDGPGQARCLSGTAEIPLAGMYAGSTVESTQLPVRLVGVGKAFRREAGARGKAGKGLYRVHEFNKVELFAWTRQEQSEEVFEEMIELQKMILRGLEIPIRVLEMASYDLGAPAYRKVDIEGWMPGRQKFGEVSSTSNCRDYQARRLHTRYLDRTLSRLEFAHTLNGTAAAIPRLIIAILENGYEYETGRIRLPRAIQSFMGKSHITVE